MERSIDTQPVPLSPPLPARPADIPRVMEWFRTMREERPVISGDAAPMPFWQVLRYDDVLTVLTDHARFSSNTAAFQGSPLADTMLTKDPPDHRKLRNLVNLAFTPRAVAQLSGRIAEITQELLDRVRARGTMDVVADLAFPLPARVIAELLGVPGPDWDRFQRWARIGDLGAEGDGRARSDMHQYLTALLEERRRSPRQDLISALAVAEVDGERLSERELIAFCVLLLLAGQETTKNLIANFVLTLDGHPEDREQVIADPSLVPGAIEEVLRYLPPVWFLMRRTTTEVELSGVRIPADQMVLPWVASANRDAAQFANPERFDIRRDPNRHVAFGHGIHFCVGAPLARLEAAVALPMMLDQLPNLRVVPDAPITISAGIVFVINSLPVTFG